MSGYCVEAFGPFDHNDETAAFKLALDILIGDGEFEDLRQVMAGDGEIQGLAGDPGWTLQRKSAHKDVAWPLDAAYCAEVDPEEFRLTHPKAFLDDATFKYYVRRFLDCYTKTNPNYVESAKALRSLL